MLSAILRQNPRFHAGMSSPVASLFEGMVGQVSAGSELSTMVTTDQRRRLLKGLFDSYYGEHEEDVIFDTNRAWTGKLSAILQVFPDAKVICCVRDIAWIMDSLERQFRADAFENTALFNNPGERATVYTRLEALAHANRLVGFPYHALREACWSDHAEHLLIVDYDMLVAQPKEVLSLLYQFIGEEPFEHAFDNVEYDAPAFDKQLGVRGLHKVHKKVEPRPRQTILPPDLFERYCNMAFWRDLQNCKAYRLVQQPQAATAG
jgi:sulfotransferase